MAGRAPGSHCRLGRKYFIWAHSVAWLTTISSFDDGQQTVFYLPDTQRVSTARASLFPHAFLLAYSRQIQKIVQPPCGSGIATSVACKNARRTPSPVKALVSRYCLAPIRAAKRSPLDFLLSCWRPFEHARLTSLWVTISEWLLAELLLRVSSLQPTRRIGTPGQKRAASGAHFIWITTVRGVNNLAKRNLLSLQH